MQEVYNQLFCLLIFIITGIVIGILFDIFRILRKSFKTADWITYLQDILFWVFAGCVMLFSIFTFNNGEIRNYVFIGIILGIILYMLSISRFFVKFSVAIIKFFKKIISYPIHLIKKLLRKIIVNPALFLCKKSKDICDTLNKKIHNLTKSNINQCKKRKKINKKEGILQKM